MNDIHKITELYSKAPKHLQDFIKSDSFPQIFIALEKKYKLSENETRVIQEQSISYLFEIISLDEIETELALELRDRTSAEIEKIVSEVKETILIRRASK